MQKLSFLIQLLYSQQRKDIFESIGCLSISCFPKSTYSLWLRKTLSLALSNMILDFSILMQVKSSFSGSKFIGGFLICNLDRMNLILISNLDRMNINKQRWKKQRQKKIRQKMTINNLFSEKGYVRKQFLRGVINYNHLKKVNSVCICFMQVHTWRTWKNSQRVDVLWAWSLGKYLQVDL